MIWKALSSNIIITLLNKIVIQAERTYQNCDQCRKNVNRYNF